MLQMVLPTIQQVKRVNTGVDWLTITVKEIDARERVYLEWQRIKIMLEKQGHICESWSFHGYAGLRIGSARWGTRHDSDIAMLSGNEACLNWLPFAMLAKNVTRLDLQVTVTLSKPFPAMATVAYGWLDDNPDLRRKNLTYTVLENTNGGSTLYIGSRASDQYGRFYDKGKERNKEAEKGKEWRYEVEFKGQRAKNIIEQLRRLAGTGDVEQAISNTVHTWFAARELPPVWAKNGQPMTMDIKATVTSDELKLLWLTKQVRPSVRRLLEHGRSEELMLALGIDKENL